MVIEDSVLAESWRLMGLAGLPSCPPELDVVSRSGLLDLAQNARDAVFIFNALNHVPLRRYLDRSCTLIADFLVDLRLEKAGHYVPLQQRLITKYRRYRWSQTYRRSISDADIILVNGQNKLAVIEREVSRTSRARDLKILEVPFSVDCDALLPPGTAGQHPDGAKLRIFAGGRLQAWQRLGQWPAALKHLFANDAISNRLACRIHLVPKEDHTDIGQVMSLSEYPNVTLATATIPFYQYLTDLYSSDIVIDLHQPTTERKFAMSTRAVVAICAGRPVIHQRGTELSGLLSEFGAGFLVDPNDEMQIENSASSAVE